MPAAVSATFNSVSPILTPVVAAHEQHRANRFAVGNNRTDDLRRVVRVLIFFRRHCHHSSAALLIQGNGLSAGNGRLQRAGDRLVAKLLARQTARRHHLIAVHNHGNMPQRTEQAFRVVLGKG